MNFLLLGTFVALVLGSSRRGVVADRGSISCVSIGICQDVNTGERFTCLDRRVECCTNSSNQLFLDSAPRGKHCCPGYGLFDRQTHTCEDGRLNLRPQARYCPYSFSVHFNADTQVCCRTGVSGQEPVVFLKEDGHECCSDKYISNSTTGCCNGRSYDKTTECCDDNSVVKPKDECSGCSLLEMEKRFKKQKQQGSYMYAFVVGKRKFKRGKDLLYKIKSAKQFIGPQGKLKTIKKKLKSFTMPKDGCPGHLKLGSTYVVMSKSKARGKKLDLKGDEYFIIPVESSDIFARIFNL